MPFDDAGVLEQLDRAIHGRDRDAVVDLRSAPISSSTSGWSSAAASTRAMTRRCSVMRMPSAAQRASISPGFCSITTFSARLVSRRGVARLIIISRTALADSRWLELMPDAVFYAAPARSTPCRRRQCVIPCAPADFADAAAPVEPARRRVVLADLEEHDPSPTPRAGPDEDRAAGAPAPCRAATGHRDRENLGFPAAIRDRMKPTRLRPTAARCATARCDRTAAARAVSLQPRWNEAACSAAIAAASRAASTARLASRTGGDEVDHRRGRRAASCGCASGARR